jgi:hypothetical protein
VGGWRSAGSGMCLRSRQSQRTNLQVSRKPGTSCNLWEKNWADDRILKKTRGRLHEWKTATIGHPC